MKRRLSWELERCAMDLPSNVRLVEQPDAIHIFVRGLKGYELGPVIVGTRCKLEYPLSLRLLWALIHEYTLSRECPETVFQSQQLLANYSAGAFFPNESSYPTLVTVLDRETPTIIELSKTVLSSSLCASAIRLVLDYFCQGFVVAQVCQMDGTMERVQVCLDWCVSHLRDLLAKHYAVIVDDVRLICAGYPMNHLKTLAENNVTHQSKIHMLARVRGDIGVWERNPMQSLGDILRLVQFPGARFELGQGLAPYQCDQICGLWKSQETDYIELNVSQVVSCIGDAWTRLIQLFGTVDFIKLRKVTTTGQSIRFHTDVSRRTLQILLNDEFTGNDLVYVCNSQFVIPKRFKGCYTIHHNDIVHAVTSLQSGTRYSLFLLKA